MTDDTPESFLGRWSRAKRAAAKADAPPEPMPATLPETPPDAAPESEPETDALSPEELEALPRVEELTEGSDIRAFLRAGVPRELRNAAMRRMWMLTPAIRDYSDPAVDYAWDWNTPGGVPGDGIGPSPEKAAKMFEDLFKPRDTAPAVETAKDADAGLEPPAPADTADAVGADSAQPDPTAQAALAAPDSAETAAQDAPLDPEPLPRRRHGSALPG